MKVITILGTRPEIIRLSRIIPKLDEQCEHILVNTRQNFDVKLNDIFFKELGIREPDHSLDIDTTVTIGSILNNCQRLLYNHFNLTKNKPDRLLVLGDTNSALSVIMAKRMGVPVYHMEAGNRCYDDIVPEEVNRRIIDHCSDVLLPYTERCRTNLLREGIANNRIYVTGNPMTEVIKHYGEQINASNILNELNLTKGQYFLVTAHREENVDNKKRLSKIITACTRLSKIHHVPIIFSRYPRTAQNMRKWGFDQNGITYYEPFGFLDFVQLQKNALCVVTDSGTVPEECCIMRVPNIIIRDVTERPEIIECGSTMLAGIEPRAIISAVNITLTRAGKWQPPADYTDNNVSDKVVKIILGFRANERG